MKETERVQRLQKYVCYECNYEIAGEPRKIDGKRCPECKGRLILTKSTGLTPHICVIDELHEYKRG